MEPPAQTKEEEVKESMRAFYEEKAVRDKAVAGLLDKMRQQSINSARFPEVLAAKEKCDDDLANLRVTSEREKEEVNRQRLASQDLAKALQEEIRRLEGEKETSEREINVKEREINRLADEVNLKNALAQQSQEAVRTAQEGVRQAQTQLVEEQRKGNPEQLVALRAALQQEQQRAQRAEQERLQTENERREAQREKQRAEQEREAVLTQSAFSQGVAAAATQTLEQLQQTARQEELLTIKEQQEQVNKLSAKIDGLNEQLEQDHVNHQAQVNDLLAQINELNEQLEQDHVNHQAQVNDLNEQLLNLEDDCENAQMIVQWHRQPYINIVNPPQQGNELVVNEGSTISFVVLNRGVGGKTVAFFNYADRTEYVDITNEDIKEHIIRPGFVGYGAFNF